MYVNYDQLERGVMNFYEKELAQKASGVSQFAMYFLMASIPKKLRGYYDTVRQMGVVDDMINPDGLIDLDMARGRASEAMGKCNGFTLADFRFGAADVDRLYSYIQGG